MLGTLPSVTVSGANQATALSSSILKVHSITVSALSSNQATVWVGDANVNSTPNNEQGTPLIAGAIATISEEESPNGLDPVATFIASTSATARVAISYTQV